MVNPVAKLDSDIRIPAVARGALARDVGRGRRGWGCSVGMLSGWRTGIMAALVFYIVRTESGIRDTWYAES